MAAGREYNGSLPGTWLQIGRRRTASISRERVEKWRPLGIRCSRVSAPLLTAILTFPFQPLPLLPCGDEEGRGLREAELSRPLRVKKMVQGRRRQRPEHRRCSLFCHFTNAAASVPPHLGTRTTAGDTPPLHRDARATCLALLLLPHTTVHLTPPAPHTRTEDLAAPALQWRQPVTNPEPQRVAAWIENMGRRTVLRDERKRLEERRWQPRGEEEDRSEGRSRGRGLLALPSSLAAPEPSSSPASLLPHRRPPQPRLWV